MKRDKKWAKNEVIKLWGRWMAGSGTIHELNNSVISIIDKLDEPERVVVPKFVADWIEEMKQDERPLYSVMSSLMNKTNHEWAIWKSANMNFSEIVAQAWLDGYEVEKEKLYRVELPSGHIMYMSGGKDKAPYSYMPIVYTDTTPNFLFTEAAIKAIDERYWPFAVEVADTNGE